MAIDSLFKANALRERYSGSKIELCAIFNAKSGGCREDCKFCAQSARHHAKAPLYPLKSPLEMIEAARRAKAIGASRFGIVTSGNCLSKGELKTLCETLPSIREVGLLPCASLGALSLPELQRLAHSGLQRYHHNLETSARFFPSLVTTHSYEERIETIQAAKEAGLEVCSGGILGLGEEEEDRRQLAETLKALEVDSIPLNFLIPIAGTPFENFPPFSAVEAIKAIALFRLICENKSIRLCAGRETVLKDFGALAFLSGANGLMIGGYLTERGRALAEDQRFVEEVERLWAKK